MPTGTSTQMGLCTYDATCPTGNVHEEGEANIMSWASDPVVRNSGLGPRFRIIQARYFITVQAPSTCTGSILVSRIPNNYASATVGSTLASLHTALLAENHTVAEYPFRQGGTVQFYLDAWMQQPNAYDAWYSTTAYAIGAMPLGSWPLGGYWISTRNVTLGGLAGQPLLTVEAVTVTQTELSLSMNHYVTDHVVVKGQDAVDHLTRHTLTSTGRPAARGSGAGKALRGADNGAPARIILPAPEWATKDDAIRGPFSGGTTYMGSLDGSGAR